MSTGFALVPQLIFLYSYIAFQCVSGGNHYVFGNVGWKMLLPGLSLIFINLFQGTVANSIGKVFKLCDSHECNFKSLF